MHDEVSLCDPIFTQLDDFKRKRLGVQADTFILVRTKDHRLSMLEHQARLASGFLLFNQIKYAVVIDRAVLINLDKRRPFMRMRALEHVGQMLCLSIDASRDELGPCAQRKATGI